MLQRYLSAGALEISPSWQEQPPMSRSLASSRIDRPSQPGLAAATTTVFGVNSPFISPPLNDYLHLVTHYPIQQVLAPRFATRSLETLCDAGTSPGAKPNNFSALTISRRPRRYDCGIQFQAFAHYSWIDITLRCHRCLTSNSSTTNTTLVLQSSRHGDGLP